MSVNSATTGASARPQLLAATEEEAITLVIGIIADVYLHAASGNYLARRPSPNSAAGPRLSPPLTGLQNDSMVCARTSGLMCRGLSENGSEQFWNFCH